MRRKLKRRMRRSVSACAKICGRPCRLVSVCAAYLVRMYGLRLIFWNRSDEHGGVKIDSDLLLLSRGRGWRNVGELWLEFWIEKLLTATWSRDVWSFLSLRFAIIAVMACRCVRHGNDGYATNAHSMRLPFFKHFWQTVVADARLVDDAPPTKPGRL
jgi:hypothetical protein